MANPVYVTSQWMVRKDSAPAILGLLLAAVGFFWLFNLSSLPLSNPRLMQLSGGEGLLDLRPFYTAHEAYTALDHYGQAGRALYLRFLAADFFFILVYSIGFGLLFTRLLRALFGARSPWMRLNLLPLGIGLFDGLENLLILAMLLEYPHTSSILGTLAGIATLIKTALTLAALSVLGLGGVRLSFQLRR